MADYIAWCRSNYFRVKDHDEFDKLCTEFDLEKISDGDDLVGFIVRDGGIPFRYDDETNEEICFLPELSKHLVDGEVAIIHEIGYEKMRYLNAYGVAVNSKNEMKEISFMDLYKEAKKLAGEGHDVTPCEY